MKKLLMIAALLTVPLLYLYDDDLWNIADFECDIVKREIIGYPVRICSIAFDDKGLIGRIEDEL